MLLKPRNIFEIQTIQTLTTHKIYSKLTQPVSELLLYKWDYKPIPEHLQTKVERDFLLMKYHYPLIKDSVEETKNQFHSDNEEDNVKSLLMLMLKLYSLKDKKFKGVIYGSGSSDIIKTYKLLIERNYSNGLAAELRSDAITKNLIKSFDKIYCAHNFTILSEFSESKISSNLWEDVSDSELSIFFQDPTIHRNVKKRIFMCSMVNGFIKNSEEWSSKVGIFLHYWHVKQRRSEDKYYGNFDLTIYMGNKRLNCYYNDRRKIYDLQYKNIDDPILMKLFLDELSGILDCKLQDILDKTRHGSWTIIEDKVLQTIGGGFKMVEMNQISSVNLEMCTLSIDGEWTRLLDNNQRRVFNIETGLLSSYYKPELDYDFRVFGLNFLDLCQNGCFDQSFDVRYKSKLLSLSMLIDLEVNQPDVSSITKRKLPFTQTWDLASHENLSEDIILEDTTEIFRQMMEVKQTQETLSMINQQEVPGLSPESIERINSIIGYVMQTDATFSMKTSLRVQHSRKIFLIIKNLKYDLIGHQILDNQQINSQTIKIAKKIVEDQYKTNIVYALTSIYDRMYAYEGQLTPTGVNLKVDKSFLQRFPIFLDDEEE
jgi:hypothetical protein